MENIVTRSGEFQDIGAYIIAYILPGTQTMNILFRQQILSNY